MKEHQLLALVAAVVYTEEHTEGINHAISIAEKLIDKATLIAYRNTRSEDARAK